MSALPRLVDSHCHLDFDDFAAERGEVVARARRAGVGTMVTICTKITEFPAIRAIAETDPDIWCTVGIHPHEAASEPDTDEAALVAFAGHPKVIGIGECGSTITTTTRRATGRRTCSGPMPARRSGPVCRWWSIRARRTGIPRVC